MHRGFPSGSSGKEPNLPMQETQKTQVRSLDQEDTLEEGITTLSSCEILHGESHGQWILEGYSP